MGTPVGNLQAWRDFEMEVQLPPLEEHLCLLGATAKGLLLRCLLVHEGTLPVQVVIARERALLDVGPDLPEGSACILSPYFKSTTGTKIVKGFRVEGGEGHGPRKEFFVAASEDALRVWESVEVAPAVRAGHAPAATGVWASCRGRQICL